MGSGVEVGPVVDCLHRSNLEGFAKCSMVLSSTGWTMVIWPDMS